MGKAATAFVLALLVCAAPAGASAQDGTPAAASPLLPADHWALGLLRTAAAQGLVDGPFAESTRRPTVLAALDALQRAYARAGIADAAAARVLGAGAARLAEEFPATAGLLTRPEPHRSVSLEAAPFAGYRARRGAMAAGSGYQAEWTGPVPREDLDEAAFGGNAALRFGMHAVLAAQRQLVSDGELDEIYASARWRAVSGWAGRRAPGYGPGRGGALVFRGEQPLNGGGVGLAEPVRLDGWLRPLGWLSAETFVARLDRSGGIVHPLLWGAHGSLQPHARFGLGVTRGAVFAGEGGEPVTLRNFAYLLIGKHGSGGSTAENHVVAVDLWYRPPVARLPLVGYLEWGFEDSAGAWKSVPGIVAGVELTAVPGLPALSVGIERAHFDPSCCGNPIWYRHMSYQGGWTARSAPLGHPLGGHGHEWLGHARLLASESRYRLELRAFQRERGEENLYAPARQGRSRGGSLMLAARHGGKLELRAAADAEWGQNGWNEYHATASAHWFIGTR